MRGCLRAGSITGPASLDRPDLHLVGQRILLDEFAPSYVIVDDQGQILVSSARVERYLEFAEGPFHNNVVRLARSGLRTALRQALAEAIASRKKIIRPAVPLHTTTSPERVTITVQPMPRLGEADDMLMVVFQEADVGDRDAARTVPMNPANESVIEELERELATTRDDLERSIQDLESANEELKSSNEELLSMNEELQSANEELESSKEEIQAANDALGRSNADLENLLASSEIATIFLDDELRVQRFTPPATSIYNLMLVDVGRPIHHITHNAIEMPAIPDERGGAHQEIRTTDGRLFLRRVLPYRTHEGQQEGIVVTFADVTDLRDHQELLQRHAAELEAIYNSSPIGLAVIDTDLRYRRVNRFLAMLNGASIEEHIGRRPSEIVGPLGHDVEAMLQRVVDSGEPVENAEIRGLVRGGRGGEQVRLASYIAVRDAAGRIIGINAVVQDVTQRSREEQDLRESERLSRVLAEAAPVLIWMADPDKQFVFVNKRWLDFTGRRLEAEIGNGWCEGVHADDLDRTLDGYAAAFSRRLAFEVEFRLRRHDGEYRWVLDRGVPRYGYDGTFEGYTGGCIDVTDRLHAELELAQAKRVADAANRAKSDFLANMSHEIRTPMTAILGYADVLAGRLDDPEDRKSVETIKRNGHYLVQIVNDILDLSKIEAGKLQPEIVRFSASEALVDLQDLLQPRAQERGLELEIGTVGRLPATIEGDPTRLRQILVNLVGNAIKFTNRGRIEVLAELLASTRELRFAVTDTGIGMDADVQGSLFEPFTQADTSNKRRYGGSGLGLAISKRLVEALGGRIWVESKPGEGSTFWFTVPTGPLEGVALLDDLPARAEVRELGPLPSVLAGRRMLLVDDNTDVRDLLEGYLAQAGASVARAGDGVAALVRFESMTASGGPPDAIVLDMQMPVLDGYETAERLRAAGYRGPIIAVTASAMKGDRERCIASGCNVYLTKPLSRETLLTAVGRYCGSAALAAESAADSASQDRRRVLVVDDHEDAAESLAMLLAQRGFQMRTAFSAAEALEAIADFDPDSVLLDIGLPDLDGYTLLAKIREDSRFEGTLFIALSGHAQPEDIERSRAAGFHHHVTKPPDLVKLRELLGHRRPTRREPGD